MSLTHKGTERVAEHKAEAIVASTVQASADLFKRWAEYDNAAIIEGFEPREGHLYSQTRAISARINQNFDGFPSEELKASYATFLGKPVFVNHANDDPTRARGRVVASRYVENGDDKYIEVIQEVNAQKFPSLAKELIEGGLDSVSMGCVADRAECSICANISTGFFDMCDHVANHKGTTLKVAGDDGVMQDKLVYERCHGIRFFELSYVFDPADETAVVNTVVTASKKHGYGETEAPPAVDTLRSEGEEETDDYHRYVESPAELSDPDLDKAGEIDRREEKENVEDTEGTDDKKKDDDDKRESRLRSSFARWVRGEYGKLPRQAKSPGELRSWGRAFAKAHDVPVQNMHHIVSSIKIAADEEDRPADADQPTNEDSGGDRATQTEWNDEEQITNEQIESSRFRRTKDSARRSNRSHERAAMTETARLVGAYPRNSATRANRRFANLGSVQWQQVMDAIVNRAPNPYDYEFANSNDEDVFFYLDWFFGESGLDANEVSPSDTEAKEKYAVDTGAQAPSRLLADPTRLYRKKHTRRTSTARGAYEPGDMVVWVNDDGSVDGDSMGKVVVAPAVDPELGIVHEDMVEVQWDDGDYGVETVDNIMVVGMAVGRDVRRNRAASTRRARNTRRERRRVAFDKPLYLEFLQYAQDQGIDLAKVEDIYMNTEDASEPEIVEFEGAMYDFLGVDSVDDDDKLYQLLDMPGVFGIDILSARKTAADSDLYVADTGEVVARIVDSDGSVKYIGLTYNGKKLTEDVARAEGITSSGHTGVGKEGVFAFSDDDFKNEWGGKPFAARRAGRTRKTMRARKKTHASARTYDARLSTSGADTAIATRRRQAKYTVQKETSDQVPGFPFAYTIFDDQGNGVATGLAQTEQERDEKIKTSLDAAGANVTEVDGWYPIHKAKHRRATGDIAKGAEPDQRIEDIETAPQHTPSKDEKDSQYPEGEYGGNAGDNIKTKDESTTDFLPGAGKTSDRKASGLQAVRCAEAYIAAGLESEEDRWKLAHSFENMSAAVILERTALLERVVASHQEKMKMAGTRGASVQRAVPQNMAGMGRPSLRQSATSADTSGDFDLFL